MFALGLISGLLLAIFTTLVLIYSKQPIERTLNQAASKMQSKGVIIQPEPEDLTTFLDSLKDEDVQKV